MKTKQNNTAGLVATVQDKKRGCGWRKEGSLYFRADGMGSPCDKMPFELTICPCCNAGVKQKIGFQWFNPRPFVEKVQCTLGSVCLTCPLGANVPEKAGLIWIGGVFYKTPGEFLKEAGELGVSRRIHNVPKGFVVGRDWVFVAHRQAITKTCECKVNPPATVPDGFKCDKCKGTGTVKVPGCFHAFKPNRVEYVVTGKESKAKLEKMIADGITPVKVERLGETVEMSLQSAPKSPKRAKNPQKKGKNK